MKPGVIVRLDDLPLFATDRQLAQAIVGKDAADRWLKERMPTLANRPGFPKVDDFHGGRPVALVKRFYESYIGLPANDLRGAPDGPEDESAWSGSKRRG